MPHPTNYSKMKLVNEIQLKKMSSNLRGRDGLGGEIST